MRSGLGQAALRVLAPIALIAAPVTLVVASGSPVGALTTIPVTTPTDAALRAAFTTANATNDDVEIDISVGSATISLTGGELDYTGGVGGAHSLTVKGNGATIDQTTPSSLVIKAAPGQGLLTLDGMTISGGSGVRALFSTGPFTVSNSTLTGNTVTDDVVEGNKLTTIMNTTVTHNTVTATGGGFCDGIIDSNNVAVTGSTMSNNTCQAVGTGGAFGMVDAGGATITDSAIVNNTNSAVSGEAGGTVATGGGTVVRSTISGNTNSSATGSAVGGGVNVGGHDLTVTNSTIANNTNSGVTTNSGGGIFQDPPGVLSTTNPRHPPGPGAQAALFTTTLVYSTVTGNTAATGANITADELISFGSVVAHPSGSANCSLTLTTVTHGYNFADDTSCGLTDPTDHQAAGADPMLAGLAKNGGPAPTQLPLPGSPLIDAIPVASCQADGASGITTDERGITRPQGAGCDIGAVEVAVQPPAAAVQPPPAPIVVTPRFTG
jgi:hypothetical protein